MKIAGYIADLLYEHECVVIPGLGGFISRDHRASVHPVKHYFKPPGREIVFNPYLRTNDGLLLSYIARFEQLSYQEARGKLDRFVLKCLSVLDDGKRINFRKIGSISYNKDKQIVFEPDERYNYLSESFGLTPFVSPPVSREEFQHTVERVFSRPPQTPLETAATKTSDRAKPKANPQRMVASKRPGRFRRQLIVVGTVAAAMLGAWGFMNRHMVQSYYQQYSSYASILPFFYASPNEYLIKHMDKVPLEMLVLDNKLTFNSWTSGKLQPAMDNLQPSAPYKANLEQKAEADVIAEQVTVVPETVQSEIITELAPDPVIQPMEISPPVIQEKVIAISPKGKEYYIIAGAFRERKNAENLIRELQQKQFDAGLAGQTTSGLWRVYFEKLQSEAVALERLQFVKMKESSQAWLLVL